MTELGRPAAELDAIDPLATFRDRFAGAESGVLAYLDGNSLGRPVLGAGPVLDSFVRRDWGERLIRAWDEQWMELPTVLGDRLGRAALGAASGQVVIGDSTSVLLYKLIRAAVDATPGRREIVVDRSNFPTDRFIVQGVAAERGLTVRWVDVDRRSGVAVADLADVVTDRTALAVLSHVAYRSGFLADAAAITAQVHEAGARMLWDLSHSVGAVPLQLDEWGVDLAVGCTYKYLNGGPGSPAFCYVRADLQSVLQQPIWGWMGAAEPFAMAADFAPATGIRRFVSGTPAVVAMQPMSAMLALIEQAGMSAIRRKSVQLTERAVGLFDTRLAPLGATLASPRDPARRGSHVTVDHPGFREAVARLWKRGVMPDFRPPDGLRIGLSPLSTSFAELDRGIDEIRATLVDLG